MTIGATSIAILSGVIYGLNKSTEKEIKETNTYNYELSIHPKIIDYGMVDGCHVKHVTTATKTGDKEDQYNYYTTASFYTADCNGTNTTTETKVNGKYVSTTTTIKKPKMN